VSFAVNVTTVSTEPVSDLSASFTESGSAALHACMDAQAAAQSRAILRHRPIVLIGVIFAYMIVVRQVSILRYEVRLL
jgi:hypothetical protein